MNRSAFSLPLSLNPPLPTRPHLRLLNPPPSQGSRWGVGPREQPLEGVVGGAHATTNAVHYLLHRPAQPDRVIRPQAPPPRLLPLLLLLLMSIIPRLVSGSSSFFIVKCTLWWCVQSALYETPSCVLVWCLLYETPSCVLVWWHLYETPSCVLLWWHLYNTPSCVLSPVWDAILRAGVWCLLYEMPSCVLVGCNNSHRLCICRLIYYQLCTSRYHFSTDPTPMVGL